MPVPYGLDEASLDRLSRMLQDYEAGRLTATQPVYPAKRPPIETRIGQATGLIPAIVGNKPGSGPAEIYKLSNGILVDAGEPITAYNLWGSPVFAGDWLLFVRDPYSGQWFVVLGSLLAASSSSSTSTSTNPSKIGSTNQSVSTNPSTNPSGNTNLSGSSSGNGVVVVTHVECSSGGLIVNTATLSASVTIGGVVYPVTLTLTGGGSA